MRRVLVSLAVLLALAAVALAAAVAAAVVWRVPLAEWAGHRALAYQGYPEARFEVAEITPRRTVVRDLTLGPDAPTAETLNVQYSPRGLAERRVEQVTLTGLAWEVDLTRPDPLEPLRPLLALAETPEAAPDAPPARPAALPRIAVERAAIAVHGETERMDLVLDALLTPNGDDMDASVQARAESPHTSAELDIAVERLLSAPRIDLGAVGRSDLARLPWPAAWNQRPTGGMLRFDAALETTVPADAGLPPPQSLLDHRMQGHLNLDIADGESLLAQGIDASAALAAETGDGRLLLRLSEPAAVEAAAVMSDALADLGLPEDTAEVLAGLRHVTLTPWTEGGEVVQLRRDNDGWQWDSQASLRAAWEHGGSALLRVGGQGRHAPDLAVRETALETLEITASELPLPGHRVTALHFDGHADATPEEIWSEGKLALHMARLDLEDIHLDDLRFEGPVQLSRVGETLAVELPAPGRLQAARWPDIGPLQLDGAPALNIVEAQGSLDAAGFAATLRIDPGRLTGALAREEEPPLPFEAVPGPVALAFSSLPQPTLEASLADARLRLPEQEITAERIELDAVLGHPDDMRLRVAAGRIADDSAAPVFAPLRAKAMLTPGHGLYHGDGEIAVLGTQVALPLRLQHDPDRGSGWLHAGPAELEFALGAVQPETLSPLAAEIRNAVGRLALDVRVDWAPESFDGAGEIEIDDLSFTADGNRVEGLQGRLAFAGLLPPRTEGAQHLRARRIVAGVPLESPAASFTLAADADAAPVLHLHHAEASFAEGLISVDEVTLRPELEGTQLRVRVEEMDMARLLEMLELEEISGEGKLSGEVPLQVRDGTLTIDDGRLDSLSTGVLRVRLDETGDILAGQSEYVRLMVHALEDFRYDSLALTLTRPEAGASELGVHLEGHNPDVLDGHPFRFNITFSGDVETVLAALQEGQRLGTALMQQAIEGIQGRGP